MKKMIDLQNKIKIFVFASLLALIFAGCEKNAEVLEDAPKTVEFVDQSVDEDEEDSPNEEPLELEEESLTIVEGDLESEELTEVETEAESEQKAEAEPYNLHFVDAWGEWHDTMINTQASMHDYNWDNLENDGQNIAYEDDKYQIQVGVDVSSHLGDINWETVRNEGYEFAIIRALYRGYGESGSLNIDKKFKRNIELASEAGLDIGVYVFSQAIDENEAIEEADMVLDELDGAKLQLPIVYDPEHIRNDVARTDDVEPEQFTKNAIAFCERVKEAGYTPMIYSNMIWEAECFDMQRLDDYKFWYADYESVPQTPYDFEYWQFTEKGIVKGVDGYCDIDVRFIEK